MFGFDDYEDYVDTFITPVGNFLTIPMQYLSDLEDESKTKTEYCRNKLFLWLARAVTIPLILLAFIVIGIGPLVAGASIMIGMVIGLTYFQSEILSMSLVLLPLSVIWILKKSCDTGWKEKSEAEND